MKGEPLRLTAGRSIESLTTSEQSLSEPAAGDTKETTSPAPSAVDETAPQAEERTLDKPPAAPPPATIETSSQAPGKPVPQKSTAAKAVAVNKAPSPAKPVADKIITPSPPPEPQPSLPVSMIVRPDSAAPAGDSSLFPGELEESFDHALARVKPMHARNALVRRVLGAMRKLFPSGAGRAREPVNIQRMVAFDGFRDDLFEDKRERDRRYGTVYTVVEAINAFVVRLELPRRMPRSSLKQTWELSDEMPDYACSLSLTDNVLCVRAGLPDEARRRLSYVSSSFPSDFQTRIEFHAPVAGYKHRLRNKVLEVIVYKKSAVSSASMLSQPEH
jgi:hypothetical protein